MLRLLESMIPVLRWIMEKRRKAIPGELRHLKKEYFKHVGSRCRTASLLSCLDERSKRRLRMVLHSKSLLYSTRWIQESESTLNL